MLGAVEVVVEVWPRAEPFAVGDREDAARRVGGDACGVPTGGKGAYQREIRRIEDVLRAKGVRVTEVTKIVRLALRVAFSDKTDTEVQALCAEMSERWKRGG